MFQSFIARWCSFLSGVGALEKSVRKVANVTSVSIVTGKNNCKRVCVQFAHNNNNYEFPAMLLRDICRCNQCFHPSSSQRLFVLGNCKLSDFEIARVDYDNEKQKIIVKWAHNDQHSDISYKQLLRAATSSNDVYGSDVLVSQRKLWLSKDTALPVFDFEQLASHNDNHVKQWIQSLIEYGAALIVGTPCELDQVNKLSECVANFKKTNYGETFQVKTKPSASNLAYTSNYIPPHADLPYWDYVPGVQLLHCIVSSKDGGQTTLVDGIALAYKLKKINRTAYDTLTKVKCLYENVGKDAYGSYYFQKAVPVINLGQDGETIVSVREGNFQRSHFVGSADQVEAAYDAYLHFYQLLVDPAHVINFRLNPGEIVSFNNVRVLHGREMFASNQERLLQGAYFDWDELLSRLRR